MIVPTGHKSVNNALVLLLICQKAAKLLNGGLLFKCAGFATETEVSDTSTFGELFPPTHSTEHVAAAPCKAGGHHISMDFIRPEKLIKAAVVLVTVAMTPVAESIIFGEITPENVLVIQRNLNLWLCLMFELN
jgi:hypothetical protein